MFEKEINKINNYYLPELKGLGNFISFKQLESSKLHPAILKYISSEISFLIFEDRQTLLKNSVFDYSSESIRHHFNNICQEIKESKRFSLDYLSKLLLHGISFNVHFLINANWTLTNFVFEKEKSKEVSEIRELLKYAYSYDYLINLILSYFDKKKIHSISRADFEELLENIDALAVKQSFNVLVQEFLKSLNSIMGIEENKIPVSAVKEFLKAKKLDEELNSLAEIFNDNDEYLSVDTISEALIKKDTPSEADENLSDQTVNEDIDKSPELEPESNSIIEETSLENQINSDDDDLETGFSFSSVVDDDLRIDEDEANEISVDDNAKELIEEDTTESELLDNKPIFNNDEITNLNLPDEEVMEAKDESEDDEVTKSTQEEDAFADENSEEANSNAEETESVEEEIIDVEITDPADGAKLDEELKHESEIGADENSVNDEVDAVQKDSAMFETESTEKLSSDNSEEIELGNNNRPVVQNEETLQPDNPEAGSSESLEQNDFQDEVEENQFSNDEDEFRIEMKESPNINFNLTSEKENLQSQDEVNSISSDQTDAEELQEEDTIESGENVEELFLDEEEEFEFVEEFADESNKSAKDEELLLIEEETNEDSKDKSEEERELLNSGEESLNELDETEDSKPEDVEITSEEIISEESNQQIIEPAEELSDEEIELSNEPENKMDTALLLRHKNISDIIELIFDYDMSEFTSAIEKIGEAKNENEALDLMKIVLGDYKIDETSKEAELFKKTIMDYYKG